MKREINVDVALIFSRILTEFAIAQKPAFCKSEVDILRTKLRGEAQQFDLGSKEQRWDSKIVAMKMLLYEITIYNHFFPKQLLQN